MAKISGSIPNFANGVSQQAMALRLASQGDLQVNAYSTVVDGLKKRPPTQRKAKIQDALLSTRLHTHMINRDAYERYEVVFSANGIQVHDLINGVDKTVTTPDGISYLGYSLSGANVNRPPYRTYTVGDYTFVANTDRIVGLDNTVYEPNSPSEAIVHVMAGNYGKDYKININGATVAWYRTPDGTNAAQTPAVDTNFIARRLATGVTVALAATVNGKPNGDWAWKGTDTNLNANSINTGAGWVVAVVKNTIYIRKTNGDDFSIGVDDGYNGQAMKVIHKEVQDFADLPSYAFHNMAVKVTGSINTKFDDYYVRFGKVSPSDDLSTPGVWREIPAPGLTKALHPATMPHVLIRNGDGTFTFKQADWGLRKAGDDVTAPKPSFVGKRISEVSFFKNRLVFLADENVVLSKAAGFFDFWRTSATALMDDDPIDVASAEVNVSVLRSAIPFADRLVLFADQTQFTFQGNELLTPKTASIRATTAFSTSQGCRPVSNGSSIFFPVNRGQYSMIREYRFNAQSGEATAEDVTGHIPQYLPGKVIKMAASTSEDILMVLTDKSPSSLWVYKYFWNGEQQLQASWSEWKFPGVVSILDMGFIESTLYLVVDRGSESFIETMDIQPGGVDDYARFVVHLDRRFRVEPNYGTRTYDPYVNETTVPMPYSVVDTAFKCVTAGKASYVMEPGLEIQIVDRAPTSVVLKGDLRNVPLYFGTLYESRYRLSTIFIRQQSQNGGTIALTEGRLQLLSLLVQFSKTAYFKVEVTPMAREKRTYFVNGRMMGDPNNRVDIVTINDGTFKLPVLSKNDRVTIDFVNDSYLPSCLISAEWQANYVKQSQRV